MAELIRREEGYYAGQLLVATPQIQGSCFEKSVIYMCNHSSEGAMGVIINQPIYHIKAEEILENLDIEHANQSPDLSVFLGGPVDVDKGFVLHTPDYVGEHSVMVEDGLYLTSNREIIERIANNNAPEQYLFTLGYSGWSAGQLELEVEEANSWFTAPANHEIIFEVENGGKWIQACRSVGVDPFMISETAGHA